MKEKPKTKICKYCKTEIPFDAKVCPQCRKKQGGMLKWIVIIFVILIIIASVSGGREENTETDRNVSDDTNITNIQDDITDKIETVAVISDKPTDTYNEDEDEDVPTEYKSALNKANTYSDMMHMSKTGIYDQLTSEYGEKFSSEAAQYAIDNMVVDWNANALAKAKEYSDTMHMSKAGIYDQLTSEYGEQFTSEEAQYAIDNVEADWNANALEKARSYQDTMDMSPTAIHDQLTSEYGEKFTQEEADYAIANLD